jgi:hypothetical protein
VTQLVLPLSEASSNPAAAESVAEPLHAAAVDPATASSALTETSCLCVRV